MDEPPVEFSRDTWLTLKTRLNEQYVTGDDTLLRQMATWVQIELTAKRIFFYFTREDDETRVSLIERMIEHRIDGVWYEIVRRHYHFELVRLYEMNSFMGAAGGGLKQFVRPEKLLIRGDARTSLDSVLNRIYVEKLCGELDRTIFYAPDFLVTRFFTKNWATDAGNRDDYDADAVSARAYFVNHHCMGTDEYRPHEMLPPFGGEMDNAWTKKMRHELTLYEHYRWHRTDTNAGYQRMNEDLLIHETMRQEEQQQHRYMIEDLRARQLLYATVASVFQWLRLTQQHRHWSSQQLEQLIKIFDRYIHALHTSPASDENTLSLFDKITEGIFQADGNNEVDLVGDYRERQNGVLRETNAKFSLYDAHEDARVVLPGDASWLLPPRDVNDRLVRRQECILWLNVVIAENEAIKEIKHEIDNRVLEQQADQARKEKERQNEQNATAVTAVVVEEKKKKRVTTEADEQREAQERIRKRTKTTKVRVTNLDDGSGASLLRVSGRTGLLRITAPSSSHSKIYVVSDGFSMPIGKDVSHHLVIY